MNHVFLLLSDLMTLEIEGMSLKACSIDIIRLLSRGIASVPWFSCVNHVPSALVPYCRKGKYNVEEDDGQHESEVTINNTLCIIYVVEGNWLLVYIWRVSDYTWSCLNEYPLVSRHVSEFASDSHIGSATLPDAPNVLSGAPACSQTYHNHSNGTPVPVISDFSYSQGRPECPCRVWYCPAIDASKCMLHICSDTLGGSQWLKCSLLIGDWRVLYIQGNLPYLIQHVWQPIWWVRVPNRSLLIPIWQVVPLICDIDLYLPY